MPAHVALETYSVLTRLPPPHRTAPSLVVTYLAEEFPAPYLVLPSAGYRDLITRLSASDVSGGAIYDGVVAATAMEADAILLTRDRRAASVYEVLGVTYELIG